MHPPRIRPLLTAAALAAAAMVAATPTAQANPPIKHVFVISLENENAGTTFGPSSAAPYLAHTLTAQGAFVPNYYGTGHESLDNYIAMVSGQGPNPQTQADCQDYADFAGVPGAPNGQAIGTGCVYPAGVQTIANQLQARGLDWRGYMEDMGNSPPAPGTCRHPTLNGQDTTQVARPNDAYAARHDPFVYFHSIIDDVANCSAHVVPLTNLPGDLASHAASPSYSFITPNLCHDGHDAVCAKAGEKGGLAGVDEFLSAWVPRIMVSPAYSDGGLLAIVFDESASDNTACCGEQAGPNSPLPGIGGPGGGRTGAVFLSPYIAPGTTVATALNHYSLLRSFEDLFGLSPLGFAGTPGLATLGPDVFTRPGGLPPARPPVRHVRHRSRRCRTIRRVTRVHTRHGVRRRVVRVRRCAPVTHRQHRHQRPQHRADSRHGPGRKPLGARA